MYVSITVRVGANTRRQVMDDRQLIVDKVNELIDEYYEIENEIRQLKEMFGLGYRYLDSTGSVIKESGNVINMAAYKARKAAEVLVVSNGDAA